MTQREQFEVWAKKNKDKDGRWLLIIKNSRGDYIDDSAYSAWLAWQAAQQHDEPDKSVTPPAVDWVR